jgi:nifR3 family TIM-barrel protein
MPKPAMILAPMADVTDAAYRRVIARRGKPDLFITEFVSVEGLLSPGRDKLIIDLLFDDIERPIAAQFFGSKPEQFCEIAQLAVEMGFDGIDINMGCPDKSVCRQGSGAKLIENPETAKAIVRETTRGAPGLPVSVKTRIGFSKIVTETWMGHLLEAEPAAITLHLRTKKEMSKVDAHWDEIHKAVKMAEGTHTLVIGNGDVWSLDAADKLARETGVDGIMLGRAIFGNPWLFDRTRRREEIPLEEVLETVKEHALLYEELFAGKKNYAIMKKHLMAYCSGFRGAKELRIKFQEIESASDVCAVVDGLRT